MDRKPDLQPVIDEYIGALSRTIAVDSVFLFGSFARGDVKKDSDIDLVVLSPDFRTMNFIERLELLSCIHGEAQLISYQIYV